MKRIGLLVLVGVWAVLGFAQESVVDSVQMEMPRWGHAKLMKLVGEGPQFPEKRLDSEAETGA